MLHLGRLLLGAACLASLLAAVSPAPVPPDSCPRAEISCGSEEECESQAKRRELWVDISGADPAVTPTIKWCVSAGTIVSGQGTGAVVIDASGVKEEYVKVKVVIGGYNRHCPVEDTYLIFLSKGPAGGWESPPAGVGQDVPCGEDATRGR